jgi:hypothetical protein
LSTGNPVAEALKPILAVVAPGWLEQFGPWRDTGAPADRYAVVQPMGGPGGGSLVRRPITSVRFVGAIGDSAAVPSQAAEAFNAALRAASPVGVMYSEGQEPVMAQAADGRPIAEVVVSSILSL